MSRRRYNMGTEQNGGTGDGPVTVRVASDRDGSRWDRFVEGEPGATFFHRFGWRRVVEGGLGHRTLFLMAEQAGWVVGVLPLAEVRSLLFGHRLVSLPGAVYGGVLASLESARGALMSAACKIAEDLGVDALEMRNRALCEPEWPSSNVYVSFRKDVSADSAINMKSIPRKQRAMVRKGIEGGLTARLAVSVDEFYPIYAESVRNLGTPVFPRHYFRVLWETFSDACETAVISHQGKDLATVMSFYFRDEVLPYYGGSVGLARGMKANDFMYWDLMCRSANRGARMFDFGRSKIGSGSYNFKKNWGFTPEPLSYEYYLVKAKIIPAVNPNNPKYRILINAWKRLPLPLANAIGPLFSGNLG
jgi:FemAB-related protein (PEP-CTERM system-associated)